MPGSDQPLPVECPDLPVAIHMYMIAVASSQMLYQENTSPLCDWSEMYTASLQPADFLSISCVLFLQDGKEEKEEKEKDRE